MSPLFSVLVLCCCHLTFAANTSGVIQEFTMLQSETHGFRVWWNISTDYDVAELTIVHQKIGSDFTTYSAPQYNYTQEFTITDLISETSYTLCLEVKLADPSQCTTESCRRCEEMKTIPLIRDDSLIAVIVVLGIILILVLIGFLCWHYAKKRASAEEDEESMLSQEDDEAKQPILLSVPPTSNGPRRSVDFEDQDIPYITPPLDDKRNYSNAGGTVV